MGVPAIKLNLVPEPSLWRERHLAIGWSALALGALVFLGAAGFTAWSYHRASQAGQAAVHADAQTRQAAVQEQRLLGQLQQIDVDQELPRWRLAEVILSERAVPWSRLTAELEQCLVDGARLKNIERTRGGDQALLLKVRGEARGRDPEAGFIERLRKDPVFAQVDLDREAQQPGGGWEFDLTLTVAPLPPPFVASGPADSASDSPRKPLSSGLAPAAPTKGKLETPVRTPAGAASAPRLQPQSQPSGPRGPLGARPAPGGLRPGIRPGAKPEVRPGARPGTPEGVAR